MPERAGTFRNILEHAGISASDLNATTRSLDLACKVVAPLTFGLIMTYGSLLISAICIAAWNLASVLVEYALLSRVYAMVSLLAVKQRGPGMRLLIFCCFRKSLNGLYLTIVLYENIWSIFLYADKRR